MIDDNFWNGPIHRAFVEALDSAQLQALWELLLVATFADGEFSIEERRTIASALLGTPGFRGVIELTPKEVADDLERLYSAYETDIESLLDRISRQLRDDAVRRGAFRTVVQMVKSDGLVPSEAEFARRLGEMLGLEAEVIDFATGA